MVEYRELDRPTFTRDEQGDDEPARGWIRAEPGSGAITASRLEVGLARTDVHARIDVRFGRDLKLQLWLPAEMRDQYQRPRVSASKARRGTATSNDSKSRRVFGRGNESWPAAVEQYFRIRHRRGRRAARVCDRRPQRERAGGDDRSRERRDCREAGAVCAPVSVTQNLDRIDRHRSPSRADRRDDHRAEQGRHTDQICGRIGNLHAGHQRS